MDERDEKIRRLEVLVAALQAEIAGLRRRLESNSGNSGKPPSSDGLQRENRTTSLREKGAGKVLGKRPGETLERTDSPDFVEEHRPEACSCCGGSLEGAAAEAAEARQVFEIPEARRVVTEHRSAAVRCPSCGTRNKAEFPRGARAPVQYGPRTRAAATYLSAQHFVPEDRRSALFKELFGLPVSAASLGTFDAEAAEALAPAQEAVLQELKAAPVKHLDETGIRICGKTEWLHVVGNDKATHYRAVPKRGDMLSGVSGVVVHDHWRTYFKMDGVVHSLCNAHILRELKALVEFDKEPWAKRMGRLLRRACHAAKNLAPAKPEENPAPLPASVLLLRRLYDRIAAKGLALHESLPAFAKPGKRGKPKRRPGHNLVLRLIKHKEDVLRFLSNTFVPFTNNRAEQDLRMMKVKQKVSGGFRSGKGAQDFCIIRGFLSTQRKQGNNPFHALANALAGYG